MYRLAPSGVTRMADGVQITREHPDWPAYLAWLSTGGVPQAPAATPPPDLPSPVPMSVTRYRALAAMHMAGIIGDVETIIADMHPLTQLAWQAAATFRRDSPLLKSVSLQLGMTDAEVDALFVMAASLEL